MIQKLWLNPPLAIARLGPSETPCPSYFWGPNDLRPRGTGKTTILPAETLAVATDGAVTSTVPAEVVFKDAAGFRPVCPFFELHGEWATGGGTASGPVTEQVLALFGLTVRDLVWRVDVANLKPFHYTLYPGDRIRATAELAGDDTTREALRGTSPQDALQPLVPIGRHIHLGLVQLTRPSPAFPELRLRFTPARGRVYGPTNLPARIRSLEERYERVQQRQDERTWMGFALPDGDLLLNPDAAWCRFNALIDAVDPRTNPGSLYAFEDVRNERPSRFGQSLGLVDDVCDGLVSCSVVGVPGPATARVVVGPPTYAPDRRPFVSLADGLADRVNRLEVHDPAYVDDLAATTLEIRDLMERVLETMELMNVDFQNQRAQGENEAIALESGLPQQVGRNKAFIVPELLRDRPLPLTETGRQRHRRFVSLEVFEDILRERPELLSLMVREPMTGDRYYDRRMPALMRGSDRLPMHITRRQYDLLQAWIQRLRRDVEGGS